MKFKLEQSTVKLFKFKSLCIDKSLRQDVYEHCKLRIKITINLSEYLSIFEYNKDNKNQHAKEIICICKVFTWCQEIGNVFTE